MRGPLIPQDDVDDFIVIRLRAFAKKIQRAIVREALVREDMPVLEWQVLFSIARFGSCHLAHITKKTTIDPAHGSRAVAALETKGLLSRLEDPANKRRKLISITPEGEAVFWRIWPTARDSVGSVTDQLSREDFNHLKRMIAFIDEKAERLGESAGPQDKEGPKTTQKTDPVHA